MDFYYSSLSPFGRSGNNSQYMFVRNRLKNGIAIKEIAILSGFNEKYIAEIHQDILAGSFREGI